MSGLTVSFISDRWKLKAAANRERTDWCTDVGITVGLRSSKW